MNTHTLSFLFLLFISLASCQLSDSSDSGSCCEGISGLGLKTCDVEYYNNFWVEYQCNQGVSVSYVGTVCAECVPKMTDKAITTISICSVALVLGCLLGVIGCCCCCCRNNQHHSSAHYHHHNEAPLVSVPAHHQYAPVPQQEPYYAPQYAPQYAQPQHNVQYVQPQHV